MLVSVFCSESVDVLSFLVARGHNSWILGTGLWTLPLGPPLTLSMTRGDHMNMDRVLEQWGLTGEVEESRCDEILVEGMEALRIFFLHFM